MSEENGRHVPTVDEWAHRRVVDVELDEDLVVKFRLPDLSRLISKKGELPNPLRNAALAVEDVGLTEVSKLEPEVQESYLRLQAYVIATHLVEPEVVGNFEGDKRSSAKQKAAEWVLEEMPPGHRDKLWRYSGHYIDPQDAAAALMSSLADVLPFRDGSGSDDAGGSGGEDGVEAQ